MSCVTLRTGIWIFCIHFIALHSLQGLCFPVLKQPYHLVHFQGHTSKTSVSSKKRKLSSIVDTLKFGFKEYTIIIYSLYSEGKKVCLLSQRSLLMTDSCETVTVFMMMPFLYMYFCCQSKSLNHISLWWSVNIRCAPSGIWRNTIFPNDFKCSDGRSWWLYADRKGKRRRCHVSLKALQSCAESPQGRRAFLFVLSLDIFAYDPPPPFGLAEAPLACGNLNPNFLSWAKLSWVEDEVRGRTPAAVWVSNNSRQREAGGLWAERMIS